MLSRVFQKKVIQFQRSGVRDLLNKQASFLMLQKNSVVAIECHVVSKTLENARTKTYYWIKKMSKTSISLGMIIKRYLHSIIWKATHPQQEMFPSREMF